MFDSDRFWQLLCLTTIPAPRRPFASNGPFLHAPVHPHGPFPTMDANIGRAGSCIHYVASLDNGMETRGRPGRVNGIQRPPGENARISTECRKETWPRNCSRSRCRLANPSQLEPEPHNRRLASALCARSFTGSYRHVTGPDCRPQSCIRL
ncbi:hypothetical protein OH76DRAFT_357049 [Lentinus brumalis]|uniref:Uncharacterized protein n=1 Tax=Lentinus brumalis TaxID=2498619 RepID=A0A371DFA6_9APHY|nr:hypothetical protein OH76DRAFT_357049 [Polyporus brumalis]